MHGQHHLSPTGRDDRRRLLAVLAITGAVMVAEAVAAWLTGSLALAADAGHMFTDAAGVATALVAMTIAQRAPGARSTFGLYRLEIFAAVVNSVILLAVAGWIMWTAVLRLSTPPEVDSGPMLVVAMIGLVANAGSLWLLRSGSRESLNMRGAYLEVWGDLVGSAAVVIAALLIAVTGRNAVDPITALAVAMFIVPRTWLLLREASDVLLEATPRGLNLAHIRDHMLEIEGVSAVHDLHVWTISSQRSVMSAHVVVEVARLHRSGEILDALQACLGSHFDVRHSTFQIEPQGHADHELELHP